MGEDKDGPAGFRQSVSSLFYTPFQMLEIPALPVVEADSSAHLAEDRNSYTAMDMATGCGLLMCLLETNVLIVFTSHLK